MSKEKSAEWRGGHEPFRQTRQLSICFSVIRVFGGHILIEETGMSRPTTESKHLLSHTIAEWACGLKYEDLSPEAIQAAKLFWFDSIGFC